ncbi:hypothetical protein OWV82_001299 [Melia azedarach]|uniref:Uncharacterized protein n=1 Tax=Melia azedarach TaxID=155640 RepID=A0ACC1Z0I9_MELAZ|nr:hypothetical protein OWV82_001299 [Melia azedarach]
MERITRRLYLGRSCWKAGGAGAAINSSVRLVVTKASNRAAVHGAKVPRTKGINEEEVEREVEKGKQEKIKKRQEVEKTVDSLSQSRSQISDGHPPNPDD